jgi:hypothetical protein
MISAILIIFLTLSAVVTIRFINGIIIPLIAQKIADWQWSRLHPNMPLHRRPLA